MIMFTEAASLMEGEWSYYRGEQIIRSWEGSGMPAKIEGEWLQRQPKFNRGRRVMLRRWPV